mgnify:CR=1 FL=1
MPSKKKLDLANQFNKALKEYSDFFITGYKGLTVADVTELRTKLREKGAVYQIVKNNVFKIALNNQSVAGLDEFLTGPNAILFANDLISSAKVIKDFLKDKTRAEKLKIKGGFHEGKVVDTQYIEDIANLPSREELLTRFVWGLKSPLQKMVVALKAIEEKKQDQQ